MIINRNTCSYFLIILWILLIIPSSLFINSEIIDYPSFVNVPNSWGNNLSDYSNFWEVARVKPILVNGMFVCGFHCRFGGESCLFAISIFKTGFNRNSRFSPRMVWSANRNNPVDNQSLLQLTPRGNLTLKDADGALVWSPKTVGNYVSSLNLSVEGNLMLFDKTNHLVWQSFDHPTDTLVVGQRLVNGQKLRSSVSPPFNLSEGLYAFALIDGNFTASIDADPSQIYYTRSVFNESNSGQSYAEFQTGMFGSFNLVAASACFIQLGSDGHLREYKWIDINSTWKEIDLFDINRCEYPLACGKYGVCLERECSCPEDVAHRETRYFWPINYTRLDLGCSAFSPISCEHSPYHSFLELHGVDYVPFKNYDTFSSNYYKHHRTEEDCKEACLKNCSCKAVIYKTGYCYFLSEVLSIKGYSSDYATASAFIKVQNIPNDQSSNKNLSSLNPPERKKQDITVILGSTLGVIVGVLLICTFLIVVKKRFKEIEEDYLDNISGMPTRFSYEELKNMTKNFSNKLGEGGFGSVFHGQLPFGSEVAVKHLDGVGPVNKSFIAEVQTVGSIHHFNLKSRACSRLAN
ncbi:hypothetical protein REPUB_Repub08aG0051200 [Reevesia pubescens]